MEEQTPFVDHAAPVLAGDPALSDENRASLWDVFHQSKDHNELAQKLQTLAVPDDTKQKLYEAKKKSAPMVAPVDRAAEALTKIANLDPRALELAEKYPTAAKLLVTAASKGAEKEAAEAGGAGSPAGKGKAQDGAKKLPPLQQTPRPDGLKHLPPIPDGHYRVQASDGGIHDIPAENIDKARETDPRLHVLNP